MRRRPLRPRAARRPRQRYPRQRRRPLPPPPPFTPRWRLATEHTHEHVASRRRPLLVGTVISERDIAQREITIMADKALPYEVLKRVMATCTDADYGRISLAVIQKEKPVAAGQFKPV